jgi:catenin alpha
MPNFAGRVEIAVDALSTAPPKEVDENEFIDASRLVYDGVREIRRAVLMNRVSTLFIVINNTRVAFNFKNPG